MDIIEKFYKVYQSNPSLVPDQDLFEIVHACYVAYRKDLPLIADSFYDELEGRLLKLDPNAIERIEASMTDSLYRQNMVLPHEMGGIVQLNDVAASDSDTNKQIIQYLNSTKSKFIDITHKLDGCSVMLQYSGGKLRRAFSKHSGDEGLDITRHIIHMKSIPKTIPSKEEIFVRGEAIIQKTVFELIWGGEYVNPRNFVAGKLNAKVADKEALKDIHFVAYTLCDSTENRSEQLQILHDLNFFTVYHHRHEVGPNTNKEFLDRFVREAKESSSYELDGIVIDPVGEYDPELSRKYKVIAEVATTKVIDVEWNLRKDGDFRPVVILEPIQLGGVTVSRASAFNAFYIKHGRLKNETHKPDHPIGPGAVVTVIRSGDVIPDIQSVVSPADVAALPQESQWGEMEWSENGVHLRTKNMNHISVKLRNLSYFFDTIKVDGFRETSVKKVLDHFPEHQIEDICRMTVADFLVCGFGQKQAETIVQNIRSVMSDIYPPRFMAATNFFGRLWAEERCEKVWKSVGGDIFHWSGMTRKQIIDHISGLDGFAKKTAEAFADGIHRFTEFRVDNSDIFVLQDYQQDDVVTGDKLVGWEVVFTGFRDEELESLVVSNGGVISSWTKANVVVAKDTSIMRPKIQKLIDKGARFLSRGEFVSELRGLGI